MEEGLKDKSIFDSSSYLSLIAFDSILVILFSLRL